ncbi:WD repeat-containing protein 53 isoform X1 [Capsicum chacoense]
MEEPRKLKGHKGSTTCCIASLNRPGLIATAAEDGCVCWFDLRCKDRIFTMDVGNGNPVSSICFMPGNEDVFYVSLGSEVKCFDVNMVTAPKLLHSYNYNKDEINQIACSSKSSFLAAADDSGDVKIIDIRQNRMYKTLRDGHTSICSSVQFIPWRPWEVITGGLDSKLVLWDFSKGRQRKIWDFGTLDTGNKGNTGQCLNPAFVHALTVPDVAVVDKFVKICAVARGDGVVSVMNVESELDTVKSKSSTKPKKGSKPAPKVGSSSADPESGNQNGGDLHLDHSMGGHSAAVSCVTFSTFGDKGKFIISGGNDKQVKVWDWCKFFMAGETSSGNDFLHSSLSLSRKVNWLCTTPTDSENLVVCDTSKVVKVYNIR